jgi:hypothetical protein
MNIVAVEFDGEKYSDAESCLSFLSSSIYQGVVKIKGFRLRKGKSKSFSFEERVTWKWSESTWNLKAVKYERPNRFVRIIINDDPELFTASDVPPPTSKTMEILRKKTIRSMKKQENDFKKKEKRKLKRKEKAMEKNLEKSVSKNLIETMQSQDPEQVKPKTWNFHKKAKVIHVTPQAPSLGLPGELNDSHKIEETE